MAVITCYLDESGTDDLSPTAVVGGLVTNRSGFQGFDDAWTAFLKEHSLTAIHMKDFGRHGKYAGLSDERRKAIFTDAVSLIKHYRVYTLAATLTTARFNLHFADVFDKDVMGVYGMCFILAAVLNHNQARSQNYPDRISYLMDTGNVYRRHVEEAHLQMQRFQNAEFLHMGALGFDSDSEVLTLQGADVVSWTARRKLTGDFRRGFEPLESILDEPDHIQQEFPDDLMVELAQKFHDFLAKEHG
jgi:hypothetical protein